MSRTSKEPSVRVALVHDWLTGLRGGEKVLEVLCDLYPDADLFTLVYQPGAVSDMIRARRVRPSLLNALPGVARYYRQCLPLFPGVIELFDLDGYDLVISTSHCAAKAIVKPGRARHLCYCHTPMRYAWDQRDAYFGPARLGRMAAPMRRVLAALARWDRATATRVDRFVANSRHVATRIRRYYNREAKVVYPPVDTGFFTPDGSEIGPYFLVVSALVPYKRIELAIEAASRARVPLKIAGEGPELRRLRQLAGPQVEFLGSCTSAELRTLYRRAQALILPGEEDFGIAVVEAQACGRPVIALSRGGAVESVVDGVTGVLVDEPTVGAFADAVTRIGATRFEASVLAAHAVRFGRDRFANEMRATIDTCLADRAVAFPAGSPAENAEDLQPVH